MDKLDSVIFREAPVGMIIFNDKLKLIDCNKTVLTLFGVTKQYCLEHFIDLSPEYQSDGLKSSDKMYELMKQALTGNKVEVEWIHCTASGKPFSCEITLICFKQGTENIGLAYIHDLSMIKTMEENIRILQFEVEKAYYDALTGIYNRRYFNEHLTRLIKTLSRSGGKLSLLMIDIDFFKDYNDSYGHSEGDNCLRTVAQTLGKIARRADDFVARYGGEEFAVVLPNTDEDGACLVAGKLLDGIRDCRIVHEHSTVADYVTISIGVTTASVNSKHKSEDYINRADMMLYLSKRNGRDRYSFKEMPDPELEVAGIEPAS